MAPKASVAINTSDEVSMNVEIIGEGIVGNTLTAGVTPDDTPCTYNWAICDSQNGAFTNISRATGKTHKITSAEKDKFLKLIVHGRIDTEVVVGPILSE